MYPTIQAKAARLGYGLIKNHCMIDGNKRIGTHAMLVFLALNGIELKYMQKELYETILDVAAGKIEYEDRSEIICSVFCFEQIGMGFIIETITPIYILYMNR